jgi:hypothetical protein
VALDAFEVRVGIPAGYSFQLFAGPYEDLFAMLGRLIQRIRRTLSVKHIISGQHGRHIVDQTVRGRIEWDDAEDGCVPVLVVDGREISWDEFGELMMGFEGWQFKLDIIDPSGEV